MSATKIHVCQCPHCQLELYSPTTSGDHQRYLITITLKGSYTFTGTKDIMESRFLLYALSSGKVQRDIDSLKTGTTLPQLPLGKLSQVIIPLPPLPEQRAIASVLSAIQEAKEKTDAVIQSSRALKKSLMKHLFTYGVVPLEEAENVPLKETEIGLVPEDWDVVRLGNIVTRKITDGTHETPKYINTGIPFITATNINNNRIDFSSCKYISEDEHNILIQRCKPEKGDILLSKVGTLGLVAMVDTDIEFSIFVQIALIKPINELVCSNYMKYILGSAPMQYQIDIKSSQSTMKYIGVGKIAQLNVPIPPLPIQQQIADILTAVDQKIEAEENNSKALEALFKTMLHNLMTGKIRVNNMEI